MHFFQSLLTALPLVAPLVSAQIGGHCPPADKQQPNPLASSTQYPITGTINGTIAVVPIKLSLARKIIPKQYAILKKQYKAWLPSLGDNQYPAILQMNKHHDIYNNGKKAGKKGDYLTASVSFPFVDRLGDGYTAMTYTSEIIVSNTNDAAVANYSAYGYTASSGYFATCNSYEYENGTDNLALPPAQRGIDQAAWADTNTDLSNPDIAYRYTPASSSPYSQAFFHNITSQPLFSGAGKGCDNVVRLFNTPVSTGNFAPVQITGDAAVLSPFFEPKAKTVWSGVHGLKLDMAYYEYPNVACSSLKGFSVNEA